VAADQFVKSKKYDSGTPVANFYLTYYKLLSTGTRPAALVGIMLSGDKAVRRIPCVIGYIRRAQSRGVSQRREQDTDEAPLPLEVNDKARFKKGRLFVSASEIANLINLNPHVSVGDAVERLWEKNNRRSFTEALARNKLRSYTPEERLKDLGVLQLASAAATTEDPKTHQQQLRKAVKAALSPQDKSVVRDFVNTSRGIRHEKTAFETLKQLNPLAKFEHDKNLYQRSVEIPGTDLQYLISGYIDGVERNQNRVIEIKNRQHRFFNQVPLYEQVQCQAYLFLTELEVCEHTESYRGELKSTTLRFEPVFWNHIVQKLGKVVLGLDGLLKDFALQDKFLQTRVLQEVEKGEVSGKDERRRRRQPVRKSRIYQAETTSLGTENETVGK